MVSLLLESGADTGIVRGDGGRGEGQGQGDSGGADPWGQGIRKKFN